MSSGYTKLFSDIVDSSIWNEKAETCKVWVTLLALSNADGYVRGSVGWLASKAKVSIDECEKALIKFLSPDQASRTEDNEGRRIKEIDRGWIILNYSYFRNEHNQLSSDPRRIYQREWQRNKRLSTKCQQVSTDVDPASASASESESVPESKSVQRGFKKPEFPELELYAAKIGLPPTEINKFQDYYESNGWRVGKNPMKSWQSAMNNWKRNYEQRTYENGKGHPTQRVDRSIGTANEGIADQYKGLGQVAKRPNL